jgi:hypothetical protein
MAEPQTQVVLYLPSGTIQLWMDAAQADALQAAVETKAPVMTYTVHRDGMGNGVAGVFTVHHDQVSAIFLHHPEQKDTRHGRSRLT